MIHVLPTYRLSEGKELGLKEFRAKKVKEKIFYGILINTKKRSLDSRTIQIPLLGIGGCLICIIAVGGRRYFIYTI